MKTLAFLLLCLSGATANAQNPVLKGIVKDTAEKKALSNAVVMLLHAKDSTLHKWVRTGPGGTFSLQPDSAGRYVLLISYPKFADLSETIDLSKDVEMNDLALTPNSRLLQEVIVRSAAAIKIKGDTTEFTADSFVVREGATVEELLKKLPGFTVNTKGEITAQGKRVEKVLVDGEEFFGDDPTLATQNLSARAVDKVQVFEGKSEQDQLTGISTGNESKTINIKLKDNAKKGAFGKGRIGSDFDKYVDAQAFLQRFVGKKKLAAYGSRSTVTTGNLSWEDQRRLGTDNDMEYDEVGGFYFSYGEDDEFSGWNLQGLPRATTAGLHFSNKWNEDRQNTNLSYRYNRLGTVNNASYLTQNLLPIRTFNNQFTQSAGVNQQHAFDAKWITKIDSLRTLTFSSRNKWKASETDDETQSEFLNASAQRLNDLVQSRTNEMTKMQSDNSVQYKQLFKKKGRQLLATARFGMINDDQKAFLNTATRFFKGGVIDSSQVLDQMKLGDGSSATTGLKTTWSEPLNLKWNAVITYAYNANKSHSYQNTFNKDTDGKFTDRDTFFSNNFDLNAVSNSGSLIFRYLDKKLRYAFGTGLSNIDLRLSDVDAGLRNRFRFVNLTPQANFGYTLKAQTNIGFGYRGETEQPSLNQLQPLRNNTNPLFIQEGNSNLKVAFQHRLNVHYNQYKVLSQRGMYVGAGYTFTQRAIVQAVQIDTVTGFRRAFPINVDGNRSMWYYANWNKGEGDKSWRLDFTSDGSGTRNTNFINGVANTTKSFNTGIQIGLAYEDEKVGSFNLRPKLSYNRSRTVSDLSVFQNNFWTYGGSVEGRKKLPWKMELWSETEFDLQQKLPGFGEALNIVRWNARLEKRFLKKDAAKVSIVANDILNQNRGFNRNVTTSIITEQRYLRVARYFLLQLEWSFNKNPGGNP